MDLRSDTQLIGRAPAKLNLYLEVLGRRSDGFHELETLMMSVRLFDQLCLSPVFSDASSRRGEISLDVQIGERVKPRATAEIPSGADNLVVKALRLLQERSGCSLGARVRLIKRIPAGAGLGGGSSDAACALRLANRAWGLGWDEQRLMQLGAELGSDIPFFIRGGAAICRGRGEQVERLPPMGAVHFVVVKPPTGLSTPAVYEAHDAIETQAAPRRPDFRRIVSSLARCHTTELRGKLFNRLEAAASALSPWVARIGSVFRELDVVAHQLTGSGSAYFGVCRHAQHARRLATVLKTRQLGLVYATRNCQ